MPSTDKATHNTLEALKQARVQRLMEDAADLHSKGQLKRLPLKPGQIPPATRELRIKAPR